MFEEFRGETSTVPRAAKSSKMGEIYLHSDGGADNQRLCEVRIYGVSRITHAAKDIRESILRR